MTSIEETTGPSRAAVVLAGGYSRRFGDEDKVFAELDGRPLLAHVVDEVRLVTETVVVSCRDEQTEAVRSSLGDRPNVRIVTDPVTDCGPVAGVASALSACRADVVAVCAADEPFVDHTLFSFLFDRLADSNADCVVPRGSEWNLQPTLAVYQREALAEACSPNQSLYSVIEQLKTDTVSPSIVEHHANSHVFHDIDTPDDLERAESYYRRQS